MKSEKCHPDGFSPPLGETGRGLLRFTLHTSRFTFFSSPRGGWEGAFLSYTASTSSVPLSATLRIFTRLPDGIGSPSVKASISWIEPPTLIWIFPLPSSCPGMRR